jgi:long-chain acyl-CoA synthetase
VIQLSENRYEWIVLDLAIQLAQVVHVPVHAPLAGPQVAQQVHDSGARIVFASSDAQARKLERAAAQLPPDLVYVSYEPTDAKIGTAGFSQMSCLLEDVDAAAADGMKQQCLQHLSAEALATILYTSGTTGEPKGVVLNQRNLVSNTLATITAFGVLEADVRLGFLPLSHIFARTCDLYTTIAVGSQLALAESRDTVLSDCQEIKPTIINGVPYFYQLLQRRLAAESDDESGGLRELLGGNMRMCCSGGAALPDHLLDYFQRQNLPLLQGYGLTESSPVITLSSPRQVRRGAVGKPIPGVEVRIAADGEILTRGPHVMVGYWQRPEATAEVIRDGWLHTGDLGHLDQDGLLYFTGR